MRAAAAQFNPAIKRTLRAAVSRSAGVRPEEGEDLGAGFESDSRGVPRIAVRAREEAMEEF
jgi:hypothetical protein